MKRWLALLAVGCIGGCGGAGGHFGDDAGSDPVDMALPALPLATAVSVYVEPAAGIAPVLAAIGAAKTSVHVVVYLLTDDRIVNALVQAHQRGGDVKVILEQNPVGGASTSAYNALQAAGVPVQWGNPAYTLTHEKAMILDGATLWSMTGNLSASAFSQNREYILVDVDPADAVEADGIFAADWARTAPSVGRLTVAPDNARGRLDTLINAAQQELDVEWEELSDNDIAVHLQSRAKAGVPVKVIAPTTASPSTMQMLSAIKAGGVQVRLLGSPYLHAKMLLVDRQMGFIGSENATTASLANNRELGVTWMNAQVASTVGAAFDADWAKANPL